MEDTRREEEDNLGVCTPCGRIIPHAPGNSSFSLLCTADLETCKICGGFKGAPECTSLRLHCDCPIFSIRSDRNEYDEGEEDDG